MKGLSKILAATLLVAGFGLVFATRTAMAQDPAKVSAKNYKVLLENERVRVLEMRLQPGEQDNPHSHPSEVVYFTKAAKVKITLPDGQTVSAELKAGEVMWHDAWTHSVQNTADSELHAVIVELKK